MPAPAVITKGRVMAEHGRPRLLSDGTITYPHRGWEPPPVPAGYRRKSADLKSADAWIMLPVLPACEDRCMTPAFGPCGACKITYTCAKGTPLYDLSTCNRCQGL